MCDGGCAKKCLIFLNVLFFLAGAGLLGIGIWMKVDPMIVNYLHVVNISASDPLVDYAALIFIVVGAAAFVISFIGCCGAVRASQGLLFVYIVLLLVLIAGELVGAILALLYRGEIESSLLSSMKEQVRDDYVQGTDDYNAFNYLQVQLKCCGADNYTDYVGSAWWNATAQTPINNTNVKVPDTCCVLSSGDYMKPGVANWRRCQLDARDHVTESETLYLEGCHDALQGWFQQHSLTLMIIGFAVGAVQLFGIICACTLRRALRTGKYVSN